MIVKSDRERKCPTLVARPRWQEGERRDVKECAARSERAERTYSRWPPAPSIGLQILHELPADRIATSRQDRLAFALIMKTRGNPGLNRAGLRLPAQRLEVLLATLPDGIALPGRLIIVEGIDGSGKSTQLDMLRKWLVSHGFLVAYSEWNSSNLIRRITNRGKKKRLLSPTSFSLVHAADFADRMERQMLPALKAGAIVLADRYVYTAFARDVARGVHPDWVRGLYSFAIIPTIPLYFHVPLKVSLERILQSRPALKYYEAGMDLGLSDDPHESYRIFQGRILDEYEKMVDEFDLHVIDATSPLLEQQEEVLKVLEPHLRDALSVGTSSLREVLSSAEIQGRYLEGMFGNGGGQ